MKISIERLDKATARVRLGGLVDLLVDAVGSGASIGFLWPLSREAAHSYWSEVIDALAAAKKSFAERTLETVDAG